MRPIVVANLRSVACSAIFFWTLLGNFVNQQSQAGLIIVPGANDGLLPDASRGITGVINYTLNDGKIDDQTIVGRVLGLSNFQYFGQILSSVTIGANGNLSATTLPEQTFFPQSFAGAYNQGLMIAPMWDDFVFHDPSRFNMAQVNQIYETVVPNSLYAVTWSNVVLFNDAVNDQALPSSMMSAQAVLFGAAQTIQGFNFQANDIAFGYTSRTGTTGDFGTLTAEIGLHSGSNQYALLPGSRAANGLVTFDEAAAVIPWQTDQFVLFRPQLDSGGNFQSYSVSIESLTAVPEPTTVLGVLSLVAACCSQLRRNRVESTIGKADQ